MVSLLSRSKNPITADMMTTPDTIEVTDRGIEPLVTEVVDLTVVVDTTEVMVDVEDQIPVL